MRPLLAAAAAAALAGCGGSSPAPTNQSDSTSMPTATATGSTSRAHAFKGGTVNPVVAAPELGLRTFDGRPVRLADYRGKVVLVTFVYVRCPDVCPLIIDNLVRVSRRLGADAKRMRIVAVSVDPNGDTPAAVRRFLIAHRALGRVDYLVGSPTQLQAVWTRWGVAARASKDNPELIEHSGVIWGVDTRGRRATFYPAVGFQAADIEGDVRLMLGAS